MHHPLPIRQIAYFVEDANQAAERHHRLFGSGPFFILRHIALAQSHHRGVLMPFDHTSAYGQWGDVMVELVQQHNPEPSAFHDMYPEGSGRFGLHHTALFVDDLHAAIDDFAAQHCPLAQLSETRTGTEFAFVDARETYGHMIELYEPARALTGFYRLVANAARDWDGADPIRELG